MDPIQILLGRRSIRRYTSEPVSQEQLDTIMKAAMAAPSANNQQPWRFVIVNERKKLDEITRVHQYAQMIKEAPVAIIVCADTASLKSPGFWPQDLGACTQNILLAAYALGLGTCWCGVYPSEARVADFQSLFGLPEAVVPYCVIALGHPAEEKPPSNRYDVARIHYNTW